MLHTIANALLVTAFLRSISYPVPVPVTPLAEHVRHAVPETIRVLGHLGEPVAATALFREEAVSPLMIDKLIESLDYRFRHRHYLELVSVNQVSGGER